MTYEDACVALELMKAENPEEYESLLKDLAIVVEGLNRQLESAS